MTHTIDAALPALEPTEAAVLYTVAQVAALLTVPERTVRYWCRRQQLPATQYGRAWLVHSEDLREFLDKRREQS